mmetsp:Transcript_4600/g.16115  ORF Transcript_4600/g.16115 Transcript_4600/m.16115 type:complete len:282 (+) Transcript_4600:179-1024(+)
MSSPVPQSSPDPTPRSKSRLSCAASSSRSLIVSCLSACGWIVLLVWLASSTQPASKTELLGSSALSSSNWTHSLILAHDRLSKSPTLFLSSWRISRPSGARKTAEEGPWTKTYAALVSPASSEEKEKHRVSSVLATRSGCVTNPSADTALACAGPARLSKFKLSLVKLKADPMDLSSPTPAGGFVCRTPKSRRWSTYLWYSRSVDRGPKLLARMKFRSRKSVSGAQPGCRGQESVAGGLAGPEAPERPLDRSSSASEFPRYLSSRKDVRWIGRTGRPPNTS